MTTRRAARRWALAWEAAWRRHEPELLRAVYAEHCDFRPHPLREPYAGIEGVLAYARWAFESECSAEPWFDEPLVDADRALVAYRAFVVDHDGVEETIAGCALLRFDREGRVTEERDYWAAGEGHLRPPESGALS